MTFSLIGRCARTGQFGAVAAGAAMATGARVAFCAAGIGAALTQHRTDPRLGPAALALLAQGMDAEGAVRQLMDNNPEARWRQIAVLDRSGQGAVFSGARTRPEMSEAAGPNVCAIGNLLASARVPAAMRVAFDADPALPLPERLVRALEEGLAAGGDMMPLHSAHLLVVDQAPFPVIDLRIDWHDEPVTELRALWERFAPLAPVFLQRALDPDNAPFL